MILGFISFMVVVLLGWLVTEKTIKVCCGKHSVALNSVIYPSSCFSFNRISLSVFRHSLFSFFSFLPFKKRFSMINVLAFSARRIQSIFFVFVFVKFRKRLNLFAFRTLLCYDLLRHSFFLIKKLCLEPITAHTVVGLSYCTVFNNGVK